ncbi:MAG: iron-sulfur cluster assembly protein [Patescibacteria group bacterium]
MKYKSEDVFTILKNVIDPELDISIVDLGLDIR